jgi:uncharacterized protein
MLAWLPVVLALTSVTDIPNPRLRGSWVTDLAKVLEPAAEQRIDALIDGLEADIGVQIVVVTVEDVAGTPHQFAVDLGNHWGVGQAATDNGLVFLLVTGQRRLEIATGAGLETTLTDEWLGDLQDAHMVPAFKRGDFGAGFEAGLAAVADRLRTGPAEDPAAATGVAPDTAERQRQATRPAAEAPLSAEERWRAQGERRRESPGRSPHDPAPPWTLLAALGLGVPASVGGGLWARRAYWRRIGTCTPCERLMHRLDELADDAHLDPGQQTEERLGSVDYVVFICRGCQQSKTIRRNRWFSGYSKCSRCSYKTSSSSSETLVHATYAHGGQVRVTITCRHCNHSSSHTRSTPKLTPPSDSSSSSSVGSSSSSSSSGSSFGGGSFRGGGSGSSW